MSRTILGLDVTPDVDGRRQMIHNALEVGCKVRFTNTYTGCVKYLDDATEDEDGDMRAYFSTGVTRSLAWEAELYTIEVITAEQASAEIAVLEGKAVQS